MLKHNLFSICLVLASILAVAIDVVSGAPASNVHLAGVITTGILGGFSGKVGPVVGAKWKTIDYMRSYVIPANPNTSAQQLVRAKFAELVARGRQVLATLLNVYWDPFYSDMSGFNAFISKNYSLSSSTGALTSANIMSEGTLEPTPSFIDATITGTSLVINWSPTVSGNGLATDIIKVVVYSLTSKNLYFITSAVQRSVGTATLTVPSGITEDDIAWIFFHRGTGSSFVVSNSVSEDIAI